MRLEGKVAIVTGAASGIGQACAERLAQAGAAVLVTDLQDALGSAVAAGIRQAGGSAQYFHHDVTKEAEWIEAISAAKANFGGLDVLVNNAGIGRPAPLTETTLEHWRLLMAINVEGMFLGMKHAIPLMTANGGGSIVNISSVAGMKAYQNMSAYCASKSAVKHLTKVAALECAKSGIRVNSVHPGMIRTPAWNSLGGLSGGGSDNLPDLDAIAAAGVPMGFVGMPGDIASGVLYLVSDESRYVTGAELVIDGGQNIA
jgi:NAD(P)-dependent dehydrogenase (short-subunit alcohol dehydrogenase family)